jgi:hypothetical protein
VNRSFNISRPRSVCMTRTSRNTPAFQTPRGESAVAPGEIDTGTRLPKTTIGFGTKQFGNIIVKVPRIVSDRGSRKPKANISRCPPPGVHHISNVAEDTLHRKKLTSKKALCTALGPSRFQLRFYSDWRHCGVSSSLLRLADSEDAGSIQIVECQTHQT